MLNAKELKARTDSVNLNKELSPKLEQMILDASVEGKYSIEVNNNEYTETDLHILTALGYALWPRRSDADKELLEIEWWYD